MNNKGQSLIMFVLFLPILLLILVMIYNIGSMILLKQELNDINYLAIDYALDNISDDDIIDKTKDVIIKNKSDIYEVDIYIYEEKIHITLESKIDSKISLINKVDAFNIKSAYVGYLDGDSKIIERDK